MQKQQTALDKIKSTALSAQRKAIEAQARPGESFQQAQSRFLQESDEPEMDKPKKQAALSTLRQAPDSDGQRDFFIPAMWDVSTKDSRSLMDVAVFRLSKRDKRAGETIRHVLADGYVEVKAGPDGMASIWDYDIVLMAISYLAEGAKAYRAGRAEKPGRVFRPHISDVLKFCRRSDGGRQYEEIEAALDRLKNTTLKFVRTRPGKGGRVVREADAEGLISNYRTISYAETGRLMSVEIELPTWIYREVVDAKHPEVLTIDPAFFLIDLGIGRFLYRLARRAAGRGSAKWSYETIYQRSGSTGTFKKFTYALRQIIAANDLPEYTLSEEGGVSGPQLLMTHRGATMERPD